MCRTHAFTSDAPRWPVAAMPIFLASDDEDEEEYGCDYCRNDGRLNANGHCPKCDAWYPEELEAAQLARGGAK